MNVKRQRANPKARECWEQICEIILNVKWFPRALKIIHIQVPKSEKGNLLTFEWRPLKSQSFIFWNIFVLFTIYICVCLYVWFPSFFAFSLPEPSPLDIFFDCFYLLGVFIIFMDSSAYEYKIYQVTSGYQITVLTYCWETFPFTSSPLPRFRL